jgi:osmotically-inducible protein OsmY
MLRTGWALLLCGALAIPAAARHQDNPQLEEIVREALYRSGVDTEAVQVKVRGRVVFLSGDVKTARDKLRAIQAAFSVSEVEEVESGLEVRSGGTPELEEEIWLSLIQEGLDSFVSEVLVKEGVASLRGEVPDASTRDRVLAVVRGVAGIASIRDEVAVPVATAAAAAVEVNELAKPTEPPEVVEEVEPPAEPPAAVKEAEPPPADPPSVREVEPPTTIEPAAPDAEAEPPPAPSLAPEPRRDPPTRATELSGLPQLIVRQIATYPGYTVFDQLQFNVAGTDVTLSGAVTEASKKKEIEERVRSVPGIGKIENQIRVLPQSRTDVKLRESLFRRIYEDTMFAEFAKHPNPPIHIIVENGWVTLTGMVDRLIEHMSAEAMVRNAFGVAGVSNRLRVRE